MEFNATGHLVLSGKTVSTFKSIFTPVGKELLLTCAVQFKPHTVFWTTGVTYSSAELLVGIIIPTMERFGPGLQNGSLNITDDLSLRITIISIQDEGRYFCEATDEAASFIVWNYTDVIVFSKYFFL